MTRRINQLIARCLALVLVIGILPLNTPISNVAEAASYGVSSPSTDSDGVTTWDCIWFGNYWQSDTNGDGTADQSDSKEPIKWRVLSVFGNDAFLLADQGLDCQPYNEEYTSVTWETCTMRSWLNSDFYNNAFSSSEKFDIMTTTVENYDNTTYGTEGGNNTQDNVYLLSIDEALNPSYGFTSEYYDTDTRATSATAYADYQGVWTNTSNGNCWWWLRSPGSYSDFAAYVINYGSVYRIGYYTNIEPLGPLCILIYPLPLGDTREQ